FAEDLEHRRVLRQHVGDQLRQAGIARNPREMPHQMPAETLSLISIDNDEGDLCLAGLHDDVASTADNGEASVLVSQRDEGDMIAEIDLHEEIDFPLRETSLHRKKSSLQRLCAGAPDRCEHV